ncbi:MAG TPA: hypothetical protein VF603_11910 [Allosphingosinicella sp.]|jgi:hypothetical protein
MFGGWRDRLGKALLAAGQQIAPAGRPQPPAPAPPLDPPVADQLSGPFCSALNSKTANDLVGLSGLPHNVCAMEAEAVARLIANRAVPKTPSAACLKRSVGGGDTRLVNVGLVDKPPAGSSPWHGCNTGAMGSR